MLRPSSIRSKTPFPGTARVLRAERDDRLLALARGGDERAFEALVERYRKPLVAHARCLLPAARAEDAVQQGLLQAWLALQRGSDVREVKPWLYRVVHNTAISMRRAVRDDHAALSDALAAPDTPHSDLERQIAARDALAKVAALPGLQREVLLQTAVGGRTRDQVATALGLSDGAVRGLLYRARTKLRAAATCLIPSPLVTSVLRLVGKRPPSGEPLLGTGSTTGAGTVAVLAKGGAVAVTVAVVAAGGRAVHSHLWPEDTRGADDHGYGHDPRYGHSVAAPMTPHRVVAGRAQVGRARSTRRVAARSTVTSAVSHVSVHLASPAANAPPALTHSQPVQPRATARAIGSSETGAGRGLTSVTHSAGSNRGGRTIASSPPPRAGGSDASTGTPTGGDGEQGNAGSAPGGSGSSAAAPAAPPAASTVSTGEDRTSPESSDGSDGSNVSATGGGDDHSSTATPSEATGTPSHGGDGSTTSPPATPTAPPTAPGSD